MNRYEYHDQWSLAIDEYNGYSTERLIRLALCALLECVPGIDSDKPHIRALADVLEERKEVTESKERQQNEEAQTPT